jgi:hypothetical protein
MRETKQMGAFQQQLLEPNPISTGLKGSPIWPEKECPTAKPHLKLPGPHLFFLRNQSFRYQFEWGFKNMQRAERRILLDLSPSIDFAAEVKPFIKKGA